MMCKRLTKSLVETLCLGSWNWTLGSPNELLIGPQMRAQAAYGVLTLSSG